MASRPAGNTEQKAKVAIVGGGCAAMSAAYELTHGENAGKFELTVYQLGWRLGGKGASGRGVAGRIEEHGLHLWMGHYDNAFALMRRCYQDLGLDWRKAFSPAPYVGLADSVGGNDWQRLMACFPPTAGSPGDPRQSNAGGYLSRSIDLLRALVAAAENAPRAPTSELGRSEVLRITGHNGEQRKPGWRRVLAYGELGSLTAVLHGLALMQNVLSSAASDSAAKPTLSQLLDDISASVHRLLTPLLERDTPSRYLWEIIDVVLAQVRGGIRLMTDSRGLSAINQYDIREWLAMNGAAERSLQSAFVRGLYDLAFAYEHGDSKRPSMAAGEGLLGSMRMFFTYREALFWKMHGGMGDVVFAPLYEELKRQGVRFEFFHRLENVGLASGSPHDGDTPHVNSLTFAVQATTKGQAEYNPLINRGGARCWPADPQWNQLVEGDQQRCAARDFESFWDPGPTHDRKLEIGKDFDFVVLGVSIGSIRHTCNELIEFDGRWRLMVDQVKTVATQSLQLWIREDLQQLGWTGPSPTLSAFVTPFDTWADMSHLVPIENWPAPVKTIAYFCSVLHTSQDDEEFGIAYQHRAFDQVRENAVKFLDEEIRHLWPNAVDQDGFRWDVLTEPPDGGLSPPLHGAARITSQYWRANINPSDRYVLSLPGTIECRISPLDNTFDNLTICGDWTDCGFNLGCVEAAVMSGRLAAHALSLVPRLEDVSGYDFP